MSTGPQPGSATRRARALRASRGLFLALLAWQPLWLGLIPPPAGKANWPLALALTVPLLVPLRGVLGLESRSMVWAGYLALLYFMFGVMECWSASGQALTAAVEILLAAAFLVTLAIATRKGPRKGRRKH